MGTSIFICNLIIPTIMLFFGVLFSKKTPEILTKMEIRK